ncbi:replication initiation protein [Leptotrichia sp. oral taxon 223]|uniref:replication initiation protein n=1 Tax=Leptotrichia sp. oral taxon 223 TaxID=712363 RepID=UPI0015BB3C51|nr:replication initiation protein [Leptotrichia sp. oral taxon 223]NWO19993.1 replication initiation protein [Leptotrichia sp. oral taxon 223]
MDIYAPINKHFLENKKIKISFSKALNKKEKHFLKFLFTEYNLLEKFKKTSILQDIELDEILDVLKFSKFEQLKKFLDNLQAKKLEFSIFSNDKAVLYGRFPILISYNIVYSKIEFQFAREIQSARKNNTLFSLLRFDFLVFMGDEATYNFYTYLISDKNYNNDTVITLERLKEMFDTGDKYERFFDFEKQVLKKAIETINLFSDIKVTYEKIKVGEHINNKVEKIRFKIIDNSKTSEEKNRELVQNINSVMDLIKNDVKDFHSTYELIKTYILKRNYDYVYKNVSFAKKQFKNNVEKQLKKVLLLDLAQFSKTNFREELEIINIKRKYSTSFFLQLDVANLMRQNHLENELRIIVDDGYFNEILTLKNEQILKKNFYDFKIYIQYFQNAKSIIKFTKYF